MTRVFVGTVAQIAEHYGVSRSTVYRRLRSVGARRLDPRCVECVKLSKRSSCRQCSLKSATV